MGHPQIAAFARLANGNAKATRSFSGQNTLMTRDIHDIAYNPLTDEIVIPQRYAQAILTYRGAATGNEAPIRVIHGPATQITNPWRLALDPVHKEVFIPENDHVLVFSSEADGNVSPLRILKGPDTQLGASALEVDPVHNLLIVSGLHRGESGRIEGGHLLIFNRTDEGNAKPRAVITGPKTHISGGDGIVRVFPPREEILLTIHSDTFTARSSPENFVGVWSFREP